MDEVMYVRLKPLNPKIGYGAKTRTILDPQTGGSYRFQVLPNGQRPWSKVPRHIAEICQRTRVKAYVAHSPLTFEVCTEEEARSLDAMAERERLAKLAIEAPTVDNAIDQTRRVPSSRTVGDLHADDVAPPARAAALERATGPAAITEEPEAPPAPPAPKAAPKRSKKSTPKKRGRPPKKK